MHSFPLFILEKSGRSTSALRDGSGLSFDTEGSQGVCVKLGEEIGFDIDDLFFEQSNLILGQNVDLDTLVTEFFDQGVMFGFYNITAPVAGFNSREIGRLMGLNPNTVRSRLSRALAKMKAFLR